MNYVGYYHTYKRWILASILIIIGIYIVMALDLGNEKHLISTTNVVSANNHMMNARYIAAKTFFKFSIKNLCINLVGVL